MRTVFLQLTLLAALHLPAHAAVAEQFRYYVWVDDQGIVHAEDKAPESIDYQVRIIEDINANVVPAEDFRPFGPPPTDRDDSGGAKLPASPGSGSAPERSAGQQ